MIPAPATLRRDSQATLALTGGWKPTQPWPWHAARFEAMEKVKQLGLQVGDIVARRGNAVMRKKISFGQDVEAFGTKMLEALSLAGPAEVYIELPFSPIIAAASGSLYSHAALVYEVKDGVPRIFDVGGEGTKMLDFVDWLDDVRGEQIEFLRPLSAGHMPITVAMDAIRMADPDFDADFAPDAQRLYCVENCYLVYEMIGVDLGPPTPFRELPGWTSALDMFASFADINASAKVFHVGNKQVGLLSSPVLESLGGLRIANGSINVFASS